MAEQEKVIRMEYSEIMEKSYIDYAMSVIVARAARCPGWTQTGSATDTL